MGETERMKWSGLPAVWEMMEKKKQLNKNEIEQGSSKKGVCIVPRPLDPC